MLQIRGTYVNETRGHCLGETGWYEPFTEDKGRLFRDLQREYGRCTSRIYVDTAAGAKPVGWCFKKRMDYEDAHLIRDRSDRSYVRAVWVECREIEDAA